MKLLRIGLAVLLLAGLAGVASLAQLNEPSAGKMASAADQLLASLTPEQKAKTTFAFEDKERLNWYFTPQQDKSRNPTRKGMSLQNMTASQREAALALLRAGTSPEGFKKATTIMSLEAILNELEKGGAMVRNPDWYFFTVFGTPSKTGKWGWRVEGHHLAINYTLDGGKVVASTPAFFGANPATVQAGPRKGLRTLPETEELAKQLYKALDDQQKKVAYQENRFAEIQEKLPAPQVGEPKGLAASKMNQEQRGLLIKLVESYCNRLPSDVAALEMAAAREAGFDKVHFAYNGGLEQGEPHTYRVQGPSFVVEFLNVQADSAKNPANHIHSSYRKIKGDFGLTN